MNGYFAAAAALTFTTGLVHSVMGERLIFSRMRKAGAVPTDGGTVLREPHVRIIWASWHLVTVTGWCIAFVQAWLAHPAQAGFAQRALFATAIAASMFAGSALVCVGTRARHPGWIALLSSGLLTGLGTLSS